MRSLPITLTVALLSATALNAALKCVVYPQDIQRVRLLGAQVEVVAAITVRTQHYCDSIGFSFGVPADGLSTVASPRVTCWSGETVTWRFVAKDAKAAGDLKRFFLGKMREKWI